MRKSNAKIIKPHVLVPLVRRSGAILKENAYPGMVVRIFRDLAFPGMIRLGRDTQNWSDEVIIKVDSHLIETRQIAACHDGQTVNEEFLFSGYNSVAAWIEAEYYEIQPQLHLAIAHDV